jgi:hypothetical protein
MPTAAVMPPVPAPAPAMPVVVEAANESEVSPQDFNTTPSGNMMKLRSLTELESAARALNAVGAPHPAELTRAIAAARAAETVGQELTNKVGKQQLEGPDDFNGAKAMAALAEVCVLFGYCVPFCVCMCALTHAHMR